MLQEHIEQMHPPMADFAPAAASLMRKAQPVVLDLQEPLVERQTPLAPASWLAGSDLRGRLNSDSARAS